MWHPTANHRSGNLIQPWILTVQTTAINQTFGLTISFAPVGIRVIWGDGSTNDYTTSGTKNHVFAAAGTYQVLVSGDLGNNPAGNNLVIATGNALVTATSPIQGIMGMPTSSVFINCSNPAFASLPNGLFKNCITLPSTQSYSASFFATKLTTLPDDLFSYHVSLVYVTFFMCFMSNTALTAIPPTLFDSVRVSAGVRIINFWRTFSGCSALTGPAPELWDPAQFNTTGASHADCFKGCTGLSNWASIPNDWKGL